MAVPRGIPGKVRGFSSMVRARAGEESTALHAAKSALPTAAYVHLPFCKRRCHYCDFPIVALGVSSSDPSHVQSAMESYVDLVCREIASEQCSSPVSTIFFGGGTPSLTPVPLLRKIVDALEAKHGFADDDQQLEISMEMDPGTFSREYLQQAIESCGINRVSLGVQAFDDRLLQLCGRSHRLDDVFQSIDWIKSSSLENWSLDLISSLPHQDLAMWESSLRQAIAASPTHVSVYDLQVEQGTKFGKIYKPGMNPLPSDDESAEFFKLASSMLRGSGYDHYEISNYAKPGFRCRHNLVYWKNLGYYAYGLGSTSFVRGIRRRRSKRMKEYTESVAAGAVDGCTEGGGVVPDGCTEGGGEGLEDEILDTVMLSLRLAEGIDLRQFGARFGGDLREGLVDGLEEFVASGNVLFLDESGKCTGREDAVYGRLTDPNGFLVSNEIISSLFSLLPDPKTKVV